MGFLILALSLRLQGICVECWTKMSTGHFGSSITQLCPLDRFLKGFFAFIPLSLLFDHVGFIGRTVGSDFECFDPSPRWSGGLPCTTSGPRWRDCSWSPGQDERPAGNHLSLSGIWTFLAMMTANPLPWTRRLSPKEVAAPMDVDAVHRGGLGVATAVSGGYPEAEQAPQALKAEGSGTAPAGFVRPVTHAPTHQPVRWCLDPENHAFSKLVAFPDSFPSVPNYLVK